MPFMTSPQAYGLQTSISCEEYSTKVLGLASMNSEQPVKLPKEDLLVLLNLKYGLSGAPTAPDSQIQKQF